ncbi:AraC-like ligand-binding domain-containing protein [Streptomyces olivaceoviridis]
MDTARSYRARHRRRRPQLGLAIARTFGTHGYDVALIARNRAKIEALAGSRCGSGGAGHRKRRRGGACGRRGAAKWRALSLRGTTSSDSSRSAPDSSTTLHTTNSVPAHRRRLYWREALSRTFGAVDISVPEEVYSGTVRTSPLGRIRGVTVEGDPMQTLRTRRLIAGSTNDNHVVVMLLSRGNAQVEQDKRDVHVRSGALFVYDRARPLRLTFPEPFQTKSLVLPRHVLDLGESDLRQITAAPLGRESPLGTILTPLLSRLVETAATYP